jgi:sulfur carrier protein
MRIIVNGEAREVAARTLESLLVECGYHSPKIATALNSTFIHRHLRCETILSENDRVEVVSPIEGG